MTVHRSESLSTLQDIVWWCNLVVYENVTSFHGGDLEAEGFTRLI